MKRWNELKNDIKLWANVAAGGKRVLILDYDGTLAPFVVDRDKASPYPGVRERLDAIMENPRNRVVFVTGRSTEAVLKLAGLKQQPEVWGSHGGERLLPDGSFEPIDLSQEQEKGLRKALEWSRKSTSQERVEEKPGCVAVHFRGLGPKEEQELRETATDALSSVAVGSDLSLHTFDGGVEVRVPGKDKGRAVRSILSEESFTSTVFYLGDDLTDEDAFAALEGRGISVLVRNEFRQSIAGWWLNPPEDLLAFLDKILELNKM
jgi:trehalose-phosphatase